MNIKKGCMKKEPDEFDVQTEGTITKESQEEGCERMSTMNMTCVHRDNKKQIKMP